MVTSRLRKILTNDWVISLFLLAVFLAKNGYTYGWDDQHLEIPLLKALIDPTLYVGDYYVQSLKSNFLSLFYPILAKCITVEQIPAAYLTLYLLSRYFLFFFIYKLWKLISGRIYSAVICALTIILIVRVEEFLYRTFSHSEFALAFAMAGVYYFYKERFLLAAALLGLAVNFHALYALFPFLYLIGYLLWRHRREGIKSLFLAVFKPSIAFLIFMLPLVIMIIKKHAAGTLPPVAVKDWFPLYMLACPQNFIFYTHTFKDMFSSFSNFFDTTNAYGKLLLLYLLNFFFLPEFRKDLKTQSCLTVASLLLIFSAVFSHIIPIRFIVDLNLIRNDQYMLFFLVGYTTLLFISCMQHCRLHTAWLLAMAFPFIRFSGYIQTFATLIMLAVLGAEYAVRITEVKKRTIALIFSWVNIFLWTGVMAWQFRETTRFNPTALKVFVVIVILLTINYLIGRIFAVNSKSQRVVRQLFFAIILSGLFVNFVIYHITHIDYERNGTGFWQLQRNWIDMQKYVQKNTPKQALFLVPYDTEMGGFRIFSERKIVVCYRDIGIIGFDFPAAQEWQERIQDVEPFKVFANESLAPALQNAIFKYRVNYIVFMKYTNLEKVTFLKPIYQNDAFYLYQVLRNPVPQK